MSPATVASPSGHPIGAELDARVDGAAEALRRQFPDTWNAVLARAAGQTDTFPDGLTSTADPAYRFVPDQG